MKIPYKVILLSPVCFVLLFLTRAPGLAQKLDATWTLTAGGQTVKVNPNGTFKIPNISAPDNFGPGGPGTRPDFVSDDFIRVLGQSKSNGVTRYAFSDYFQFNRGQTYIIGQMTITETPPPSPVSLKMSIDNSTLNAVGQTTHLHVIGTLQDGSLMDLTPRTNWTVYRTSNPQVATVGPDGLVTAKGSGVVFFTAANNGASAVTRAIVALGDPLTVVDGIVLGTNDLPVAGASVFIVGQSISSVTDASGHFAISNVLTSLGDISVRANYQGLAASSPRITPVPGGITDAGILTLQPSQNEGREFIVVFQRNYDNIGVTLTLFISSQQATAGTVEIPGIGYTTNFNVIPGVVTSVSVPTTAIVSVANGIVNLGIHITADKPISVYGLNRKQFTTDAFTGLPIETFGTRYRAMCHFDLGFDSNRAQFAVVSEEENTTVTITPTVTAQGHAAGQPFQVTLNRFDVYQLRTSGTGTDLTGSLITSDKPVGVFSGNSCANVPNSGTGFCDHLCEEIPPTDTWGQDFLTVPLATRLNGDTFRILADQTNTTIVVAGVTRTTNTLTAGQYLQVVLQGTNQITANKPILVAQFSNGGSYDNVVSDPFMMLIPPAEQFLKSYTFATPASGFRTNIVNIVAPAADASSGAVVLDLVPVPAGRFTPIGSSGFSSARIGISLGSHTINGPNPLGIYVYGFDTDDSYGYPGGMALKKNTNSVPALPPAVAVVSFGNGFMQASLNGGVIQLQVMALEGQSYVIEASINLRDWTPISTNVSAGGVITINDPDSKNLPARFYRAVQKP